MHEKTLQPDSLHSRGFQEVRAALNSIIAKLVERIPNLSAIDSEPLQIESITLESP